jgi:hypothetical protein
MGTDAQGEQHRRRTEPAPTFFLRAGSLLIMHDRATGWPKSTG